MSTNDGKVTIDPEVDTVTLEMPLKFWWLAEVALGNASCDLNDEAMAALCSGDIMASEVWRRMAVDMAILHLAVQEMVNHFPPPSDFHSNRTNVSRETIYIT